MLILTLISTLSLMSNIYAEFNNTAGAVFNTTLLINETATHVVSPVFTHLYDRIDFSAWWNLKADRPDMNIVFAIRRLGMHFTSHCAYNSLTVYDGPGTTSPRLAAVCQSLSDKHLISSGDTMFIETHFVYFRNYEIYAFDFSSEKVNKSCGGILVANSTTNKLISPGFPRSYFNLETCEWMIQSLNMSDTILIDVRSVQLQQSSDILKIFLQNDTYNEQLIKNICSNMTRTFQVQSPRNTLSLRFETDNELVGEGFRLTYRAVPATSCKVSLMASDTLSYLYSPGYPDSYESNVSCNWGIFSKDRNMRIQVTVQLENDLVNCSSTGVLKLRDTFSSQEIVLCNYSHPTNITVHALVSFSMVITFHSGPDELGPAFRISYQQVAAPTTSYPVLTRHCNDTYLTATATEQYISSPGYPYPYSPNLACVWYITAPRGKMIHVQVVASEVEYSTGCPFDKVEAYDGATVQSSLLETWCGDRAPTFQSTGNAMLLRFTTDPSLAESGFRLKYSMTEIPYVCATNVTVTRSQTIIYSPMYPVRYPRNLNCVWDLTTDYGSNIKLMVMESNLQSYCTRDYIALSDDSGEVGSFCENNYQNYVSSGSKMRIRFYSGSFGSSGTGFKLVATGGYYKVCGKSTLSAESSSNDFTSPRYPFHYPNNADCIWVISTYYSNYFITLEVVNSDIEYSAGCLKDYLEAFDGRTTFAQSLGRWCGMFTPTKKSSSGSMTVLFHTDESYTKSGFQISYYSNLKNKEGEETGNVNDAALWGGLAGGGFLLAIVILCGRSYKKRKLSQRAQRDVRRRPARVMGSVGQLSVPTPNYTVAYSQQQVSIQPENTGEFYNAAMFDLPPSYDEVIKNNIEFQVSTCDNSVPDSGTTNSTTTESPAEGTRL